MSPDHGNSRPRVPVPALVMLAILLAIPPIALATGGRDRPAPPPTGPPLAQMAADAGCRLTEYEDGTKTNPPVTGVNVESARFSDGSYAGRRPPSLDASVHALLHGRVLFQYGPDLAPDDLAALDRLTRRDPDQVLLFENQTGMEAPVAATAYLSLMTCPRVDHGVLRALDAFRSRRRAFGQSF
jgi:uncharacterized protein DUF3105